jgi:WD40 repeat protein
MVDISNKVQIVEHINKSLSQTVYDTKWIPCSARFVSLGSPARQTGLIQIYSLTAGDIELQAELERPKAFKCGTFGQSTIAERHLATGDFAGGVAIWDLERLQDPIFSCKGHETIINCIDGCGGLKGAGAPEIATGGRDGAVHIWDPRQKDVPVASMSPNVGAPVRDCWAVAFGDAHSADSRVVAAGYDNGDVKILDLVAGKIRFETNVSNGVCGIEFDRKDIEMNKLVLTTLESRYRLYDMRTQHPVHGFSFLSQEAHQSTVWAARHLPQNRDVFMTCGGNGSLELWKYSYPSQRSIKEKDGHEKGVLGTVTQLQKKTFSTQPIASFDWNADKEGLAVMGVLDQTIRVVICTKLNLL